MSLVSILVAAALQIAPSPDEGGAGPRRELIFVPPMPGPEPADLSPASDCLMLDQVRSTRIIPGTGIVYVVSSRRQFINRVRGSAGALAEGQVMVIRRTGPLLCAGDVVQLVDGLTGAATSFVGLGKFEHYDPPVARRR